MKKLTFLFLLCLYLPGLGCVEKLSLDDRACPCLNGWRCCEGTRCVPSDQNCPGCELLCASGEQCYGGGCALCSNSKACGTDCIDCTDQISDWYCDNGSCACRGNSDCPSEMPCMDLRCGCRLDSDCPGDLECREKRCTYSIPEDPGTCHDNCDAGTGQDGGADAGMGDLGTTDGGTTDGGITDGGMLDGDDGGINPLCANNKRCGPNCQDCTELNGNWACLGNECGCFDSADCLPDQDCLGNSCAP